MDEFKCKEYTDSMEQEALTKINQKYHKLLRTYYQDKKFLPGLIRQFPAADKLSDEELYDFIQLSYVIAIHVVLALDSLSSSDAEPSFGNSNQ